MEINYELEPKDLIAFNKHNARQRKTHLPLTTLFFFVLVMFLSADFIYAFFSGSVVIWDFKSFSTHLFIRLVILAVMLGVIILALYLMQLKLGNYVAGIEDNGVLCQHKIVLNERELIEITKVNTSRHSWTNVAKIEEIEKFLLVTVGSSATFVIPKRYFKDREEIKTFLKTANYYRENASHTFQPSHLTEYEKSLQSPLKSPDASDTEI
jgi:hypothetical protein